MAAAKWFKFAKEKKDKEQLKADMQAAKPALKVLKRLIEEDMKTVESLSRKTDGYAHAAWPYYQADCVGSLRTYQNILDLISLEE